MPRQHYSNLESLRGIAALMVAICHCYVAVIFNGQDSIWVSYITDIHGVQAKCAKLILLFANGEAGVTVFFVLSGVVLGLSLDSNKHTTLKHYLSFLIKRVLRIYPAHLLALCFICTLLAIGFVNPGTFPGATMWYNWAYQTKPSASDIASNALLLSSTLNPVTWSLSVEIAVSCIFPILHYLSRLKFKPVYTQSLLLFILIALALKPSDFIVLPQIYKFYLGLLIPIYGVAIISAISKLLKLPLLTILTISIAGLLVERQITNTTYLGYGLIQTLSAGSIVLCLMISEKKIKFLQNRIILGFGRNSFSFYLWHFPILWFMYYGIHSTPILQSILITYTFTAATIVCFISVLIAYCISAASYSFIETKFIAIGRRVTTQSKRTVFVAPMGNSLESSAKNEHLFKEKFFLKENLESNNSDNNGTKHSPSENLANN